MKPGGSALQAAVRAWKSEQAMTKLRFTKMHGLGNDFVVLDGIGQNVDLTAAQYRRLADRRLGVGCDQVLVVERAKLPASTSATGSSTPMAARSSSAATAHAAS